MTDPGKPDNLRLDDQLCFALYAAANTITRAYRPQLDRIGLTYPQYLVMLVLWQSDAATVSDIARHLALPAHGVTPILDRLAQNGLIERFRDADDGRIVRARLTSAGADLEIAAGQIQANVACQTQLTPTALAELRDDLHALVRMMRDDPSFAVGPGPA